MSTSPKPKPSARQVAAENASWKPPRWEKADAAALQALQFGRATEDQQKRALRWVVELASGTYDVSFRPGGEDGRRETDFAEGRRFVGLQIVKLLGLNLSAIPNREPLADPAENQ